MIPSLDDFVSMMLPALAAIVVAMAFDLPAKLRNMLGN